MRETILQFGLLLIVVELLWVLFTYLLATIDWISTERRGFPTKPLSLHLILTSFYKIYGGQNGIFS